MICLIALKDPAVRDLYELKAEASPPDTLEKAVAILRTILRGRLRAEQIEQETSGAKPAALAAETKPAAMDKHAALAAETNSNTPGRHFDFLPGVQAGLPSRRAACATCTRRWQTW